MSGVHASTRRRLYALRRYLVVQAARAEKMGSSARGVKRFISDLDGVLKSHGGDPDEA